MTCSSPRHKFYTVLLGTFSGSVTVLRVIYDNKQQIQEKISMQGHTEVWPAWAELLSGPASSFLLVDRSTGIMSDAWIWDKVYDDADL